MSLSKVWRAIRRFSEDVEITYDIRAIAPDLVAGAVGDTAGGVLECCAVSGSVEGRCN